MHRGASIAKGYRLNRTAFDVDWRATRTDGTWFAEAAKLLAKSTRRFDAANERRFHSLTSGLRDSETAYLIATGPSARAALDLDLSKGIRIVCNTVILDDELMEHARPDIVTFADPIFHFGPSTYAHSFQRALRRKAAEYDFAIVTVERYASLLKARMPELEERIVGVRLGAPSWTQNLNLLRHLAVRPYPNILTMLMLPLAATFAREIHMIGFDGRAHDAKYFWRHGSDSAARSRSSKRSGSYIPGSSSSTTMITTKSTWADSSICSLGSSSEVGALQPRSPSFMPPLRRRADARRLGPVDPEKALMSRR